MAAWLALFHVEDGSAGHVVVDDAVNEAIQFVALTHELAANGIDLSGGDPVRLRFFMDADQRGTEHQRREADDRHIGGNAVVVVRIALGHGQSFSSALRGSDEVVVLGLASVQPLDQHHRGIMRLLELHVTQVPNRLLVQRPVVGSPVTSCRSAPEAHLVAGVAAISHEALRKRATRQHRDRAVHASATHLYSTAVPRGRKRDLEVDRFRGGGMIHRRHRAIHAAPGRGISPRRIPSGGTQCDPGDWLPDSGNRDTVAEFCGGAVSLRDGSRHICSQRADAGRTKHGNCT